MATAATTGYGKRRNVELFLVVIALAVPLGGYLLTHLNAFGELPTGWPVVAGLWAAVGLVAHLLVRFIAPYADPILLPCTLFLNGLGLVMIHRLDLASARNNADAVQQFVWTGVGVLALALALIFLRDYRFLQRFPYLLFLAGIALLLLPLSPIGEERYGSRVWVRIGPFGFQPGEIAKVVLAIAFAGYLVEKRDVLTRAGRRFLGLTFPRLRDLGPIMIMWVMAILILVYQTDLGMSLMIFGTFIVLLYVATSRPSWPILGLLMFAGAAVAAWRLFHHVQVRVNAWLHPFSDYDHNYQIIQAQFGMDWGGLAGRGLGLGDPWMVPVAKSDMIATSLGEELGLAGFFAIVVVFGIFVARGLRTALTSTDPFGKLLATALSFAFCLQVFVILGGVTRLLPLTGVTTPFMSQGGTSLATNWLLLGILMAISHRARRPVAVQAAPDTVDLGGDETQLIPIVRDRPAEQPAPRRTGSSPAPRPVNFSDEPTEAMPRTDAETQAMPRFDDETQALPRAEDEPTRLRFHDDGGRHS